MTTDDNRMTRFFVGKQSRILRHLVLWMLVFLITLSMIWYLPALTVPSYYKAIAWFIYTSVIGGSIYLNMYVGVPRLFLKHRLGAYLLFLSVMASLGILMVLWIQFFFLQVLNVVEPRSLPYLWINFFSSFFGFFFLFMGTTTLLLVKERIVSDLEKAELKTSILESELKLLKNQVNPHFLFNMLNNANMLLKKDRKQASEVVFKLEDLLRYQFQETMQKEQVSLDLEINFLNDFLKLERIRRDQFEYTIVADPECRQLVVPPMLFIVFVENAVKHNVDPEHPSYVHVTFRWVEKKLEFKCVNSKPENAGYLGEVGGIGLRNSRRRLELLYPGAHQLKIKEELLKYTITLTFDV